MQLDLAESIQRKHAAHADLLARSRSSGGVGRRISWFVSFGSGLCLVEGLLDGGAGVAFRQRRWCRGRFLALAELDHDYLLCGCVQLRLEETDGYSSYWLGNPVAASHRST